MQTPSATIKGTDGQPILLARFVSAKRPETNVTSQTLSPTPFKTVRFSLNQTPPAQYPLISANPVQSGPRNIVILPTKDLLRFSAITFLILRDFSSTVLPFVIL